MNSDPALNSRPSANATPGGADSDDDPPSSRRGASSRSELRQDRLCWIDHRPLGSAAAGIAIDLHWLVERGRELVTLLPRSVDEVAIALLDDAEMDRLHRAHCGVEGTTDVLSYPDPDAEPSSGLTGDLAIGVEVAAREASARGRRIEEEILLYAAHGLLHLAGERDDTPESAVSMRSAQDRIMLALGLPVTESEHSA